MSGHDRAERTARDTELIRRIKGDDPSALAELMRVYVVWLVEGAYMILGSVDLAQDAVQEVFTRVWDIRKTLQLDGYAAPYLYRAVTNRARDIQAHERAQGNLGERILSMYAQDELPVSAAADADILNGELRIMIDTALAKLQPRMREVFVMRAEHGMDYASIAHALGVTQEAARKYMYRAIAALSQLIANPGD